MSKYKKEVKEIARELRKKGIGEKKILEAVDKYLSAIVNKESGV